MEYICKLEEVDHSIYIIIRFFSSIINIQLFFFKYIKMLSKKYHINLKKKRYILLKILRSLL